MWLTLTPEEQWALSGPLMVVVPSGGTDSTAPSIVTWRMSKTPLIC